MDGFLWIAAIWTLTLYALYRLKVVPSGRWPMSPILVQSLFLLLLGIESTGGASTGSLGFTTVIRGLLASAALVFAVRALLVNSAQGRMMSTRRRTNLILLSAYASFAAFSTVYSVSSIQTAGKAYELVVGVVVVWAIATSPEPHAQLRTAIEMIVILWAAILLVAIPGFFALPSLFVLQEEGRPGFLFAETMAAPYAHSNGLSAIGGIVAVYAVARGLREPRQSVHRRMWFTLAGISSFGILLASGRQGVVIWAISMGIVLFMLARPLFVFFVIPVTALAVQQWSMQLWSALTRDQQETTLYTLSGRLDFWGAAIDVWKESPLIGYGFGVGGRYVALPSMGAESIGSLHSGYFEALVGVGLIGSLPLLVVVGRVARWSWQRLKQGIEPHLSILIIPLAMHTAISLGFAAWLSSQTLMLALLAACADIAPPPGRHRHSMLTANGRVSG